MSKKVLVSGRIEQENYAQLRQIIQQSGKNESQIVREAIAHYLGVESMGAISAMEQRLVAVERKLSRLQELFLNQ